MEERIEGKMWFVNGVRLKQRYAHGANRIHYPVVGKITDEEIRIGKLFEKYKVLELVGDTEMDLPKDTLIPVTAKAVDSSTGEVTEYDGSLLEYHHGWDGMDGNITTIRIMLDKDE